MHFFWEGLPCLGANFFYERQDGEILFFTNHPYWKLPDKIKRNWRYPEEGTFRIAVDIRIGPLIEGTGKKRIVDIRIPGSIPDEAKYNIEETVRIYNEQYGFEIEG